VEGWANKWRPGSKTEERYSSLRMLWGVRKTIGGERGKEKAAVPRYLPMIRQAYDSKTRKNTRAEQYIEGGISGKIRPYHAK